jgi:hypothetical protein
MECGKFSCSRTAELTGDQIPEPHGFDVMITIEHGGHRHIDETQFVEHDHGHGDDHDHGHGNEHDRAPADDPLYAPLHGDTAVLTRHVHNHRHGGGRAHAHWQTTSLRRRIP